jgi:hypothetical protein
MGAARHAKGGPRGLPLGKLLGAAVAMVLVGCYLREVLPYKLNPYDEGVIAYGAEQVLKGRRPGVEFYVPYSPGAFYAVAAAFSLFGVRLLVERAVGALLIVGITGFGYALLVRRRDEPEVTPAEVTLASATATAAGLLLGVGWVSPVTSGALALLLLSGLALMAALPAGRPRDGLLVGLAVGLLMLWRLDFGLVGLAAAGMTWLACAGRREAEKQTPADKTPVARKGKEPSPATSRFASTPTGVWRLASGVRFEVLRLRGGFVAASPRALAGAIAIGIGAAIVAGPPFAWLLAAGGRRAVNSLLVWPLLGTRAADLPWPPLLPGPMPVGPEPPLTLEQLAHATGYWPFYFPLLALSLVLWRLVAVKRPGGALTPRERAAGLWLLCVGAALFLYANGRTDYHHVLPLLTVSLLVAALALSGGLRSEEEDERPSAREELRRITGLAAFLLGLGLLLPPPLENLARTPTPEDPRVGELPGPRGAGIYPDIPFGSRYARISFALQRLVPPDGHFFSGTPRHDVFLTNDVMLYFLAERDAGTYYWCLDAGVTTTEPVQREMVQELEANHVPAVVLYQIARNQEGNEGARSSGVKLLDDYLATRYRLLPMPTPNPHLHFYDLLLRNPPPG